MNKIPIALVAVGILFLPSSVNAQSPHAPVAAQKTIVLPLGTGCVTPNFHPRRCTDLDVTKPDLATDVATAFRKGQYTQLNDWFAAYCNGTHRMPDGTWFVAHFESSLARHFGAWGGHGVLPELAKWRSQSLGLAAPFWAEALYWYDAAWALPWPRAGESRPPQTAKLYAKRLASAGEAIAIAKSKQSDCPVIASLEMAIRIDQNAPLAEVRVLFEKALKRFPDYSGIYHMMGRAHFSRSGGSARAFEDFALDMMRNANVADGQGVYARLYSRSQRKNLPGANVWIGYLEPDWVRLKTSFEELLNRYPHSKLILADYLDHACRIGDKSTYKRLRGSVIGLEAYSLTDLGLDVCDAKNVGSI